jgi:hypothetical protein
VFCWARVLRDDFVGGGYVSVETNLDPSPSFPMDELVHGEGKVSIYRLPSSLEERWSGKVHQVLSPMYHLLTTSSVSSLLNFTVCTCCAKKTKSEFFQRRTVTQRHVLQFALNPSSLHPVHPHSSLMPNSEVVVVPAGLPLLKEPKSASLAQVGLG